MNKTDDKVEQKEKQAEKKPSGKLGKKGKIVLAVCAGVAAIALTLGLCLKFLVFTDKEGYYRYFNNFSSGEVKKAEATLTLGEGTQFFGYDPTENVFTTSRIYYYQGGASEMRFGLASDTEEFCLPVYTSIVQIKGEYALVQRVARADEDVKNTYWDIIRYKGAENTPYSLLQNKSVVFSEKEAMSFVGEFLAVHGDLSAPSTLSAYSTFYDYKSWHEPLEKFRIRKGYDVLSSEAYEFLQEDDYLVAYTVDKAYFYNTNDAIHSGYLENTESAEYKAFSEITDPGGYDRELNIYYLGNGWFARSARLYTVTPFNGFNMIVANGDTLEYSRTKTDFYNVRTGRTTSFGEIFYLDNVANRYNKKYFAEQSYQLSNISTIVSVGNEHFEYALPFTDPAAMVKDGYSLVYYYYLPHLEEYEQDETNFLGYVGETTYCIIDKDMNVVQPKNALMPTAYIDDVGFTTADPAFTETRSSAYVYDNFMKEKVLKPFEKDSASYIVYFANSSAAIVSEKTKDSEDELFAAIKPSGEIICAFEYAELTYFSEGYAIGYKTKGNEKKYVRVDEKGRETEVEENVLTMFHGAYSYTTEDGKTGLKNYAGVTLIEPINGSVGVLARIMDNETGAAITLRALVTENNVTRIYDIH